MSSSIAVSESRGRAPDSELSSVGFMVQQGGRRVAVSVSGAEWKDPASWGCMLADLARQISAVYEAKHGVDRGQALRKIRMLLEAEWDYPTPKRLS